MRRCRTCHKDETETYFGPLIRTKCRICYAKHKETRKARIESRRVEGRVSLVSERLPLKRSGESTRHLAWIRTFPCSVRGCGVPTIHAHHVRDGSGGGTGMKPHDRWALPVCPLHHMEIHTRGSRTFEGKYGLSLRNIAMWFAEKSPYLATADKLEAGD